MVVTYAQATLCVVLKLERKALDDLLKRRSAQQEQEQLLAMVNQIASSNASANQETIDQVIATMCTLIDVCHSPDVLSRHVCDA